MGIINLGADEKTLASLIAVLFAAAIMYPSIHDNASASKHHHNVTADASSSTTNIGKSSFDNNFKKCFDAAPAPDFIKMGLPLKDWEAIYKSYVGNLTNGKDIFANESYNINIAKQVDICMRTQ